MRGGSIYVCSGTEQGTKSAQYTDTYLDYAVFDGSYLTISESKIAQLTQPHTAALLKNNNAIITSTFNPLDWMLVPKSIFSRGDDVT